MVKKLRNHEINKERVLKLADHIEKCEHVKDVDAKNDGKFKDHLFCIEDWKFPNCGSPACIAGHTVHLFTEIQGKMTFPSNLKGLTGHYASKILGLSKEQAGDLFTPSMMNVPIYAITPKVAAETLRHLARTGIVAWQW